MKLAIALLLALASFIPLTGPAAASEADLYWQCVSGPPANWCPVTSVGPLPVATTSLGVLSSVNSSSALLGNGGVFTGTSASSLASGAIVVNVFADQASASQGLSIQQSANGTNWDYTDTYSVAASTGLKVVIPRQAAFVRVVYTNGVTPQGVFRLQTILTPQMPTASAVKPGDGITAENDFAAVLSAQTLYNGTTLDMAREVANGTNSIGTGLIAAGLLAQVDEISPTAISENSFGNVRMSSARALYTQDGPYSYTRVVADGQIKASAGALHTITIAPTGTVTAGVLTIYDSATESGTVIYSVSLPITTFTPFSVLLDVGTTTGIFVGFDATLANVQVTVAAR